MKLIDKAAVVAEIEKLINALKQNCIPNPMGDMQECLAAAEIEALNIIRDFLDTLEVKKVEEEPDCTYNHTLNNPQITIGTKIRSKVNPDVILSIISDDCHEDEFECSNGSVLSLKQIEKYYDIII